MKKQLAFCLMTVCLIGVADVGRADSPIQALSTIAGYLESGDVQAALARINDGGKSRDLMMSMDEAARKRLAAQFRRATLKTMKATDCTVNIPTTLPSGEVIDLEMMLVPDGKGSWLINSW